LIGLSCFSEILSGFYDKLYRRRLLQARWEVSIWIIRCLEGFRSRFLCFFRWNNAGKCNRRDAFLGIIQANLKFLPISSSSKSYTDYTEIICCLDWLPKRIPHDTTSYSHRKRSSHSFPSRTGDNRTQW